VQTHQSAEDGQNGFSSRHYVAAFLLLAVAATAFLVSISFSGLACSGDNSKCARTSVKNGVYEARIVTKDGTPFRDQPIQVYFNSRQSEEEPRVAFHTDGNADLCIQWANEPTYPNVITLADTPLFTEFRGYGYADQGPVAYLGGWRDLEGQDPPTDCQSSNVGIPWYRAYDAHDSWQAKLLLAIPIGVFVIALAALFAHRDWRSRRVLGLGWLLLAADALTFLLLWNVI